MANQNDITTESLTQSLTTATDAVETTANVLEVFEKAKDLMGKLSQFGAVLGVLGVAMELVNMFTGAPSPEDIIIEKLDNLDDRVTDLSAKITDEFKKLKDWHKVEKMRDDTQIWITNLRGIYHAPDESKEPKGKVYLFIKKSNEYELKYQVSFWEKFNPDTYVALTDKEIDSIKDTEKREKLQFQKDLYTLAQECVDLIDDQNEYKNSIEEPINLLVNYLTADPKNENNLLSACITANYGDPNLVFRYGFEIYTAIFETGKALRTIRNINRLLDPNFSYNSKIKSDAEFFSDNLVAVENALTDYMNQCFNMVMYNIDNKARDLLGSKTISRETYNENASDLANNLHSVYNWLDFTVVICDPMVDPDLSYFNSPFEPLDQLKLGSKRGFFYFQDIAVGKGQDTKVNVGIYWNQLRINYSSPLTEAWSQPKPIDLVDDFYQNILRAVNASWPSRGDGVEFYAKGKLGNFLSSSFDAKGTKWGAYDPSTALYRHGSFNLKNANLKLVSKFSAFSTKPDYEYGLFLMWNPKDHKCGVGYSNVNQLLFAYNYGFVIRLPANKFPNDYTVNLKTNYKYKTDYDGFWGDDWCYQMIVID